MTTIEIGGEWWLPERPEHRVAGWLSSVSDKGLELRLIGRLRGYHDDPTGSYPRILGDTEKHEFTLETCYRVRYTNVIGDRGTETIHVGHAFRGCWFAENEVAGGDSIEVQLLHLVHWVKPKGIKVAHPSAETFTASISRLPAIELQCPDGQMSLAQVFGTSGDGQSGYGIEQDVLLVHDADDVRDARDLLKSTGVVRDIVSMALDRSASIEAVSVYHPDIADGEHREKIDVFAAWADHDDRTEPKVLAGWDCLFFFDDVGVDGFQRLLDVGFNWHAELRRVMATMGARGGYNSDRLLNRCAALESIDRRSHPGRRYFRERMRAQADIAGEPFAAVVGDFDEWTKQLKSRRDHSAHHLVLDDAHGGLVDLLMAESAYVLFVLRFLREANVPDTVFDLVLKSKRIRQLRDLPEVLARQTTP
jgi:hypothetical protein